MRRTGGRVRMVPSGVIAVHTASVTATNTQADRSAYRQDTYGANPDYYVDCTRALASAGDGSISAPLNASQAMTVPGGSLCWWLPISECANSTPVDLPHTNADRHTAAFNPSNSGTSGNPTVHVTKYAAAQLIVDNGKAAIFADTRRTELRHAGAAPTIRVDGSGDPADTGCAILGANSRNYIIFDGFFLDLQHCWISEDSGMLRAELSVGVQFRNLGMHGVAAGGITVGSNCVLLRPQADVDTVYAGLIGWEFYNDARLVAGTGNPPQGALVGDFYGSQNFTVEHCDFRDMQGGLFIKGTVSGTFNYGTIRYNKIADCGNGLIRLNDLDAVGLTEVHHNLLTLPKWDNNTAPDGVQFAGDAFVFGAETSAIRNCKVHHNTIAKVDPSDPNLSGCFYVRSNGIGSNVEIYDNLIDKSNGSTGHMMALMTQRPAVLRNNFYYANGATETYTFDNTQYNTFASYQSAIQAGGNTTMEAGSLEGTSSPFVDRANDDFRVAVGHAAKTMSSTGGEVGCYGEALAPIGVLY